MTSNRTESSRSWKMVFREVADLDVFVTLSLIGLEHGLEAKDWVRIRREYARVLEQEDPFATEADLSNALEQAARLQEFAKRQNEKRFSYLFSLTVIKLWSILESTCDNLAVEVLRNKHWKEPDLIRRLEGGLLDFLDASEDDRAEMLCRYLKLQVKAGGLKGVGRFEAVLEPLGLGGGVNDELRRSLYELAEVRNALVHRGGRADKKLLEACPWLTLHLDSEILVSETDYRIYSSAVRLYVMEINRRVGQLAGSEPSPFAKKVEAEISDSHVELLRTRDASHRGVETR